MPEPALTDRARLIDQVLRAAEHPDLVNFCWHRWADGMSPEAIAAELALVLPFYLIPTGRTVRRWIEGWGWEASGPPRDARAGHSTGPRSGAREVAR